MREEEVDREGEKGGEEEGLWADIVSVCFVGSMYSTSYIMWVDLGLIGGVSFDLDGGWGGRRYSKECSRGTVTNFKKLEHSCKCFLMIMCFVALNAANGSICDLLGTFPPLCRLWDLCLW